MDSLRNNYKILLRERKSTIHRGLLDKINGNARLVAIKGCRGVGKTNFLLDYCRTKFADDDSALYVNVNNLFFACEGLHHFVERAQKEGIRHLFLDQIHKSPQWTADIRKCYTDFPDMQIFFTLTSALWEVLKDELGDIAAIYSLHGFSFREFLEIETGRSFPCCSFAELVKNHKQIAESILKEVNPLDYFENYLHYGYFPLYLEEKSHVDFLLKNINFTLEFDIPYINQIELKYLGKLKQLLFVLAKESSPVVNISRLSQEIGVSRATILNYLYYMKNARMVTLLQDENSIDNNAKKPSKLYIHNPNLLSAVCLDDVDDLAMRKTFFMCQLNPVSKLTSCNKADFCVDGQFHIVVNGTDKIKRTADDTIVMQDNIQKGSDHVIPLWLAGFVY